MTIDRAALIEQAAKILCAETWEGTTKRERADVREAVGNTLPVIATALLAPLRELHTEKVASYWRRNPLGEDYVHETVFCRSCSADYPCPTVRLLDAIEAEVAR